jgi:hypothetical protein
LPRRASACSLCGVVRLHQPHSSIVLAIILALPGLLAVGYAGLQIRGGLQVRAWPTAPGRVGSNAVDETGVGDLPRFRPRLTYSYQVRDQWYIGNRIQYGSPREFAFPSWARGWVAKNCPEGSAVTVAYNPNRPDQAVLRPGVPLWTYVLGATGLVLAALGAVLSVMTPLAP